MLALAATALAAPTAGLEVRHRVEPVYPAAAAELSPRPPARCEATVTIRTDGAPSEVVVSGCVEPFVTATRETVLAWRWWPPIADGAPARAQATVAVNYRWEGTTPAPPPTATRVRLEVDTTPPAAPPPGVFEIVRYPAPLGENVAYVTPPRATRGPAIVWIAGGFDWGIGASDWERAPRENDQTTRAFRDAGIVVMRPSLRGSNGNPGHNECMLGEVDDVIAAGEWLRARPDVDPERVYLGGHSTGGTLALLVAARTDRFRGVVALGPVADLRGYGDRCGPGLAPPDREWWARSPVLHLVEVTAPTWIVEGRTAPSNADALQVIRSVSENGLVHVLDVKGLDHFSLVAPATDAVAAAIVAGELALDEDAITRRE